MQSKTHIPIFRASLEIGPSELPLKGEWGLAYEVLKGGKSAGKFKILTPSSRPQN